MKKRVMHIWVYLTHYPDNSSLFQCQIETMTGQLKFESIKETAEALKQAINPFFENSFLSQAQILIDFKPVHDMSGTSINKFERHTPLTPEQQEEFWECYNLFHDF